MKPGQTHTPEAKRRIGAATAQRYRVLLAAEARVTELETRISALESERLALQRRITELETAYARAVGSYSDLYPRTPERDAQGRALLDFIRGSGQSGIPLGGL